jgi:hypothetical protein
MTKLPFTLILALIFFSFSACQKKEKPEIKTKNLASQLPNKPIFNDGYPLSISDIQLDSLYDFYFWLHHRDVTDRAIARFQNQLKTMSQSDKLAQLQAHRRLTVAYMMAYDETNCTQEMGNMLRYAAQIADLSLEEKAKTHAVEAYHAFWFDVNQEAQLPKMQLADSLMRLAVGENDIRAVQMAILKSDYLSKLGKQDSALATMDTAMGTLERLPVAYPSVLAWSQLLRTFQVGSSLGFKASRAKTFFDEKTWGNHPIMGKLYQEASQYFAAGHQLDFAQNSIKYY